MIKDLKLFAAVNNIFDVNNHPIFIAQDATPCTANRVNQNCAACGNSMPGREVIAGFQFRPLIRRRSSRRAARRAVVRAVPADGPLRDAFDRSVTVPGLPAVAHRHHLRVEHRDGGRSSASPTARRHRSLHALSAGGAEEAAGRRPPGLLGRDEVRAAAGPGRRHASRQAANQLVDPMQRLGIPIVVLLQRNVPEILSNIRLLGRLTGVPERGEQLAASLQARLDKVDQRVAGRKKPSVIMITGRATACCW